MKLLLVLIFLTRLCYGQALYGVYERYIDPERIMDKIQQYSQQLVPNHEISETVQRLSNARVMIADYSLIRRDFPQIAHLGNPEIDDWLLSQVAFVSEGQTGVNQVNTAIPRTAERKTAMRPAGYGRALIYQAQFNNQSIGLLDIKGAGARSITGSAAKQNGLATLGEVLREFSFEKLMNGIIYQAGFDMKIVGSYAVIDPGFKVIHSDGSQSAAGLYVRQAHRRATILADSGIFTDLLQNSHRQLRISLEKLFQRFGVFVDGNIQTTHDKRAIFDFGHYIVRNDLEFLDPRYAIDFDRWGFRLPEGSRNFSHFNQNHERWSLSKRDFPWIWSHDTAEAFARGQINRHTVWMHHYNLLEPMQTKWRNQPRLFDLIENLNLPRSCGVLLEAPRYF